MLDKNPENRVTLEEILESPWVTRNGKDEVELKSVVNKGYFGDTARLLMFRELNIGKTHFNIK